MTTTLILPTKHLGGDRALLGVGAAVLKNLRSPITLSQLWWKTRDEWRRTRLSVLSYDVFLLALTMLYALKAIEFEAGYVRRSGSR